MRASLKRFMDELDKLDHAVSHHTNACWPVIILPYGPSGKLPPGDKRFRSEIESWIRDGLAGHRGHVVRYHGGGPIRDLTSTEWQARYAPGH